MMDRRRALMGSKQTQTAIYLGETPVMSSDNNSNTANLVTVNQPSNINFNYILVISKNRKAFKEFAYNQDTLSKVEVGRAVFDTSPYSGSYRNNNSDISFNIQARTSTQEITIGHKRMTSTNATFYVRFPQKFEIYALTLPYEEGDIV